MGERELRRPAGRVLRITSLTNPIVKEVRGLALAKNRRASGRFLAEGLKLVTDAVDSGWPVRTLIHTGTVADEDRVAALAATTRARGGDIVIVNQAVLAKITRRDNPQTVVGVFDQRLLPLKEISPTGGAVWVALERVRDPGNLGTIIRTIDAVGANGVILVGETVDPFSIEAVRATMGSIFHVPLARAPAEDFAAWMSRWPGATVGTHLAATSDYRQAAYRDPVLLVMGPEQAGLSPTLAAACNTLVKIPMAGRADSLNLAVATGVMLFEIRRKNLAIDG
ncbi:MAG: RNA methyltransferase [Hyphomicrobiales bacterium]|nr:RNA methyltransferase [Hyphomicrobiales bacterium]